MSNLSNPLNIYSETNTSISIIGKGQKETDMLTLKAQPEMEGPQGGGSDDDEILNLETVCVSNQEQGNCAAAYPRGCCMEPFRKLWLLLLRPTGTEGTCRCPFRRLPHC